MCQQPKFEAAKKMLDICSDFWYVWYGRIITNNLTIKCEKGHTLSFLFVEVLIL